MITQNIYTGPKYVKGKFTNTIALINRKTGRDVVRAEFYETAARVYVMVTSAARVDIAFAGGGGYNRGRSALDEVARRIVSDPQYSRQEEDILKAIARADDPEINLDGLFFEYN